jgi:hypothetical protein
MVVGNLITLMVNCLTKEITSTENEMVVGNGTTPTVNCGEKKITSTEKKMVGGKNTTPTVNYVTKEITSTEKEMVGGRGMITNKYIFVYKKQTSPPIQNRILSKKLFVNFYV